MTLSRRQANRNMGSAYLPKIRAQILSDWLEIALEMFPGCKAVWFDGSQNNITAEAARNNPYKGFNRIFNGAVNARFVNNRHIILVLLHLLYWNPYLAIVVLTVGVAIRIHLDIVVPRDLVLTAVRKPLVPYPCVDIL